MTDHPELLELVDFVELGDVDTMAYAINRYRDPEVLESRLEQISRGFATSRRLDYHLGRYLLAVGAISYREFVAVQPPLQLESQNVLTLPETPERYDHFTSHSPHINRIHGLRHTEGWRGSGMSFKAIMQSALERNMARLTLMEDDVKLPPSWQTSMMAVERYLDTLDDRWHVFAGLIAELHPEIRISNVVERDGMTFVHINKMVSAVFNLYNVPRIAPRLASWNEQTENHLRGQMDRWLESTPNLEVVTTMPFLVGHTDHLHSTMWKGGNNAKLYNAQIERSSRYLRKLVDEWRRDNAQ
jgi:hypothetical protein